MALPSLSKTWARSWNNTHGAQGSVLACRQNVMLQIKELLTSVGALPLTVARSCGRTSRSPDIYTAGAADYWTDLDAMVWASSGEHSWVVLERDDGIQICIDLLKSSANANQCVVYGSLGGGFSAAAGGTDGTTSARPTATDEFLIRDGAWFQPTADVATQIHAHACSDGTIQRVFVYSGGACVTSCMLEVPKTPVDGWSQPFGAVFYGSADALSLAAFSGTTGNFKSYDGGAAFALICTGEATSGGGMLCQQLNAANAFNNAWPLLPVGWLVTSVRFGRHAQLFDLWWGSTALPDGSDYPVGGTRQFVQLGDFVVSNDATIIQTS